MSRNPKLPKHRRFERVVLRPDFDPAFSRQQAASVVDVVLVTESKLRHYFANRYEYCYYCKCSSIAIFIFIAVTIKDMIFKYIFFMMQVLLYVACAFRQGPDLLCDPRCRPAASTSSPEQYTVQAT